VEPALDLPLELLGVLAPPSFQFFQAFFRLVSHFFRDLPAPFHVSFHVPTQVFQAEVGFIDGAAQVLRLASVFLQVAQTVAQLLDHAGQVVHLFAQRVVRRGRPFAARTSRPGAVPFARPGEQATGLVLHQAGQVVQTRGPQVLQGLIDVTFLDRRSVAMIGLAFAWSPKVPIPLRQTPDAMATG
jgi:hypothetical protein